MADPNENPGQGDPNPEPRPEQFDPERARATIERQREAERAARAEAAAAKAEAEEAKKKLAELEEADRKRREAEMSEAEKAKAAADEAQKRAEAAERRLRESETRFAVFAEANKQNVIDPDVAYQLIAPKVEYDANGKPTNVDTLIKKLLEDKPYLAKGENGAQGVPGTPKANGKVSDQERIEKAREELRASGRYSRL